MRLAHALPAAALLALAGCSSGSPAAAPSPSPSPSAELYRVVKTWGNTKGTGAGATLVVANESESHAQAAIQQYLRKVTGDSEYKWIEVLGHEDATAWICAGEYLSKESDKQYAVFDMSKEFVNFPADWIQCK